MTADFVLRDLCCTTCEAVSRNSHSPVWGRARQQYRNSGTPRLTRRVVYQPKMEFSLVSSLSSSRDFWGLGAVEKMWGTR